MEKLLQLFRKRVRFLPKKPKCVMILTEGPSDRVALTNFFTDLYAMIDPDIEVFFPILKEDSLSDDGEIETKYNGDITSRIGIAPENILPMLLKLFIHPELEKHPAYEYPSSVYEVIHLVDIDGAYLDTSRIVTAATDETRDLPYYDDVGDVVICKNAEDIIYRNARKSNNLQKLIETEKLFITIAKDENASRQKPYHIYYFSSNIDHFLFGKANNPRGKKVPDARKFSNEFFDEPLKLARYFLDHPNAVTEMTYKQSWEFIKDGNNSIHPHTNINLLISDLLKKAKIKIDDLPENDIRTY